MGFGLGVGLGRIGGCFKVWWGGFEGDEIGS